MVETFLILAISTLGIVLIGYVILTPILRALERPTLLLPWKRTSKAAELQTMGEQLLRAPLSADDRLAVERALNTLSIPGARSLTGPWSKSDPLTDAEQDILGVKQKIENRDRATG
jgi:hypothetical protein